MSPRVFATINDFASQVGKQLGSAAGPVITQDMIDQFGTLTGSDDWIHSDPVRAKNSRFGGTIAQADLVLAMIPRLMDRIFTVQNVALGLIYGSERVRFTSPIPVDSQIRLHASMVDATVRSGGTRVTLRVVVEIDGLDRPAMIVEPVYWYGSSTEQGSL